MGEKIKKKQWAHNGRPTQTLVLAPIFFPQKAQWVQQIVNKYKNKRNIKEIDGQVAHVFFLLNNGRSKKKKLRGARWARRPRNN